MLLKLGLSQMPFISYLKVPKKDLNLYDKSWMDPVAQGEVFWFQLSAEFKLFLSVSFVDCFTDATTMYFGTKRKPFLFFARLLPFLNPSLSLKGS